MIRSHIELTEGLNYTLTCEVSDGEQIQWLDHDGKVLLKVCGLLDYFQNDLMKIFFKQNSPVYNFTAQAKNNGKSISCEAKNQKCTARDEKSFNVHVLKYTDWSEWSICYRECNKPGINNRTRICYSEASSATGATVKVDNCPLPVFESGTCEPEFAIWKNTACLWEIVIDQVVETSNATYQAVQPTLSESYNKTSGFLQDWYGKAVDVITGNSTSSRK